MQRQLSAAFWLELVLSLVSVLLTVLVVAWPDWIERVFGVDPDAGSGASEWGIALAFIVVTLTLAALTGRTWRRDRRSAGYLG